MFVVEFDNFGDTWCDFKPCATAPGSGPYLTRETAEKALRERAAYFDVSLHRYRVRDLTKKEELVPAGDGFIVKDSGKRENLAGGMVRDTTDGKVDYTLCVDGPMFQRWADHLSKGAVKYSKRNWMQCADGDRAAQEKTLARFRESAFRHFIMWMNGATDEDHAAGVFFNLNGYEYLKERLK
jgi:hypothetical protein